MSMAGHQDPLFWQNQSVVAPTQLATVPRWPLAGSPDPDDAEQWLAGTVHSCPNDSYLTLVSAELE